MVCDGPLPPTYVFNWAFTSMDTIKAHASGTTFPEISKKNFLSLPKTKRVCLKYRRYHELLSAAIGSGPGTQR